MSSAALEQTLDELVPETDVRVLHESASNNRAATPPLDEPAAYRNTIASSVALMLAMMAVQRLIGFVRGILFCRWLEPDQLGQWDVTFGFLMLAAPVAVLGLPGSFGRYFEHYRQRGLLRVFLFRTTMFTVVLGAASVVWMLLAQETFARLIFGQTGFERLVFWTALSLTTLILHNYLVSLFVAARMYRVVSVLQFLQGVLFAAFGIAALIGWQSDAASLVIAFALSCIVSSVLCLPALRRIGVEKSVASQTPSQWSFWSRLLPFVIWIWVTNLLSGMFEMVDRYMIIHYSGLSEQQSLAMVGNYHSSRLVPLLFVSIAMLLSSMITPHLSHDWEAGNRQSVSSRLNLSLKLLAGGLMFGSLCVLLFAPILFGVLLQGKFDGGLAVLPWTLAYCCWFSLVCVAQNYLWCAEKAALSSITLLVGLAISVALSLLLLPAFGLFGAVWAASAANFTTMLLVYWLSARQGMQLHGGTLVLSIAPLLLGLGLWAGLTAFVGLAVLTFTTNWLFSVDEKQEVRDSAVELIAKVTRPLRRSASLPT